MMFGRLLKNVDGSTAIEYAVIASFASILILAGVSSIGVTIRDKYLGELMKVWLQAAG
jgi:Flp pilus assembly pilin Flp